MSSNENNNFIGRTLKQHRVAAGYTQKSIGEITGKAPQTVASWESGKSQPDITTLIILCYKYGITDFFKTFYNEEQEKSYTQEMLESAAFEFNYKNVGITDEERLLLINFRKLDNKSKELVNNLITTILSTAEQNQQ